jgi:hypothetical protein
MKYEEKIKYLESFLIENGEKKRLGTPLLWLFEYFYGG